MGRRQDVFLRDQRGAADAVDVPGRFVDEPQMSQPRPSPCQFDGNEAALSKWRAFADVDGFYCSL